MISVYDPKALIDPSTPNFKQYEVSKSDIATRNDIDNTPTLEVLNNAALVAINCMQPIRDHFGLVSINSWYRSEAVERVAARQGYLTWLKKNNCKESENAWKDYFAKKQHPKGNAVDFEVPGVSNDEVFEWCKKNLVFDQLIREFARPGIPDSGWVHISYVATGNRNQVLHIG